MISLGTPGAKALDVKQVWIAALEALRHPKAMGLEKMISGVLRTSGANARNLRNILTVALDTQHPPKAV